MNFLLPLLIGGPDMAKEIGPLKIIYNKNINKKKNKSNIRHYSSTESRC